MKEITDSSVYNIHIPVNLNKMMFKLSSIIVFTFWFFLPLCSQVFVPLEHGALIQTEQKIFTEQSPASTFLKPYDNSWYESLDTAKYSLVDVKKRSWWLRKMFYESYLIVDSPDYKLVANPLFNFSYGTMSDNSLSYYHNIRGATIGGNLLRKLYFESSVFECQSRWPLYISDYIHSSNVAPGMGQARRFGTGGFDYAIAAGSIAFPLARQLKLYLGTGKFFAGDGYRSMLLSDVAFNYPYLHLRYQHRKWYLSRVFAVTMSDTLPRTAYGLREKRLAAFGTISYLLHPRLELSFFEGYVFHYLNRLQHTSLSPLFFNPLPLTNLLKYDSSFSSIIGLNLRINFLKKLISYYQLSISNIHYRQLRKENMGFQGGFKWYSAFSIPNLYLQAEWNWAGSSAYTSSDSLLNYSHYNQPLAHLLGNHFNEKILIASYSIKRLTLTVKEVLSEYGQKNMGLQTPKSRFVEKIAYPIPFLGTGPFTSTRYTSISLGCWINPEARQKIEIGYVSRTSSIANLNMQSQLFYVSFKVDWNNVYFDF